MRRLACILLSTLVLSACKKEKDYIYEVNPQRVEQGASQKGSPKSMMEFISIAYADLFGESISQRNLNDLTLLYLSFGDKRLLEDMFIRNMLASPDVKIPSTQVMRNDVAAFVTDTYKQLFNREPNELEAFTLQKKINDNPAITPVIVYYAMMTSDEYRYY